MVGKRRKRRSSLEVKKLQEHFLKAVQKEGRISLSGLIETYGAEVDVKNTPSDKNLVKRQMDQLAAQGEIEFQRAGRELIAQMPSPPEGETQERATAGSNASSDLAVIRAFAVQLEEFSRTLQEQISTLVRMVDKASR